MTKLTLASAILVGCLAGCSSQPAATSPADEPTSPEPTSPEPDVTEPDVTKPSDSEPDVTEPDVAEPEEPEETTKPKRPCDAYPNKQMCQVVRGCAWHTQKGCINHEE